jgi:hypothetical protein
MAKNLNAAKPHPLVGRGVHFWEDGAPAWQGQIIAVVPNSTGDLALVEFFEWFAGSPTYQQLIPLAEMASGEVKPAKWTIFDNTEHMNGYWEAYGKHKKDRKAAVS